MQLPLSVPLTPKYLFVAALEYEHVSATKKRTNKTVETEYFCKTSS